MSTEKIIESGFYDSVNGDRKYNAKQMTALLDGIINDGVFAVGDAFQTKASSGNIITVGSGRAWFNSTWVYNDTSFSLTVPTVASSSYDAVDLVVIEVDRSVLVRAAKIKLADQYSYTDTTITDAAQRRTAAINTAIEQRLVNTTDIHQYPIAAIYRPSGFTGTLSQADITYLVGSTNCPMVTGILDVMEITNIVAQWESEFGLWFASVKATLGNDVATSLANEIATIKQTLTSISDGSTKVGDANKLGGKAPSEYATTSHNHKPEDIKTEGYFGARVRASVDPTVQALDQSQVRNIYAGTADMTPGETTLAKGAIYVMYE
jgi:hypothetical protein